MTHAELKKELDIRLEIFNASGQSIPKWCADQNLKTDQLRNWFTIDIDKKV